MRQDSLGRWISEDGRLFWDGHNWSPVVVGDRRRWVWFVIAATIGAVLIVTVSGALVGLAVLRIQQQGTVATSRCSGVRVQHPNVRQFEIFRWVADPRVTGFGYRPGRIGLDGTHITSAHVVSRGSETVLDITYDTSGSEALAKYSQEAVASAPEGTDVETRHMAWFLGLTDAQIANWQDPSVRVAAMRAPDAGGSLVADPFVTKPVSGGSVELYPLSLKLACELGH